MDITREQVNKWLAAGFTHKEITERLHVSTEDVKRVLVEKACKISASEQRDKC